MLSDPAVILRSHSHSGINMVSLVQPTTLAPKPSAKILVHTCQIHFQSDSLVLLSAPGQEGIGTVNWVPLPAETKHLQTQEKHNMYVVCRHEIYSLRVIPKAQIYQRFMATTPVAEALEALTL